MDPWGKVYVYDYLVLGPLKERIQGDVFAKVCATTRV